MTFGPHRKSEETYLAYTRADDSFRQLGRHVWCLPALVINGPNYKLEENLNNIQIEGFQQFHRTINVALI